MQIGVFGSHNISSSPICKKIAYEVGKLIAEGGHVLVTGASRGVSELATKGAREKNGLVVAVSPESSKCSTSNSVCHDNLSVLIRTGMPYKMRNVITIMSCDVCIFISGGYGSLNEFTVAIDQEKPCIIIKKTGGISDVVEEILDRLVKINTPVYFAQTAEEAYLEAVSLGMKYEENAKPSCSR